MNLFTSNSKLLKSRILISILTTFSLLTIYQNISLHQASCV